MSMIIKSGLYRLPSGLNQSVHVCRLMSALSTSRYKLIDDTIPERRSGLLSVHVGNTISEANHESKEKVQHSYKPTSNPNYNMYLGFKFVLESLFRIPSSVRHFSTTPHLMNAMGRSQSPINIITSITKEGPDLKMLNFSKGWDNPVIGTVENTGYYLKFTPEAASEPCTLKTYNGVYTLDHFHCHWGSKDGEGAEHLVDGKQYDIEFHFVHKKVGLTDPNARDAFTVLGIFGKADKSTKISGVWDLLLPSKIVPFRSKRNIAGVTYSKLLPGVRDYYHYEGSLTTFNYGEVVHWYVLKEPLMVPSDYLESLRQMHANEEGDLIDCNYRCVQELHDRTVQRFEDPEGGVLRNISNKEDVVADLTNSLGSSDKFIRELVTKLSW